MNKLAELREKTGRKDEAAKLRDEVVVLGRKVLGREPKGTEHRDALTQMASVAASYEATGRKDEAAKLRAELEALKAKQ